MKRFIGAIIILLLETVFFVSILIEEINSWVKTISLEIGDVLEKCKLFFVELIEKMTFLPSDISTDIWIILLIVAVNIVFFAIYFLFFGIIAHSRKKKQKKLKTRVVDQHQIMTNSRNEDEVEEIEVYNQTNRDKNAGPLSYQDAVDQPINLDEQFHWRLYVGGFPKWRFIFTLFLSLVFIVFIAIRFVWAFQVEGIVGIGIFDSINPSIGFMHKWLDENIVARLLGGLGPKFDTTTGEMLADNQLIASFLNGRPLFIMNVAELALWAFVAFDTCIFLWFCFSFISWLFRKPNAVKRAAMAKSAYYEALSRGEIQQYTYRTPKDVITYMVPNQGALVGLTEPTRIPYQEVEQTQVADSIIDPVIAPVSENTEVKDYSVVGKKAQDVIGYVGVNIENCDCSYIADITEFTGEGVTAESIGKSVSYIDDISEGVKDLGIVERSDEKIDRPFIQKEGLSQAISDITEDDVTELPDTRIEEKEESVVFIEKEVDEDIDVSLIDVSAITDICDGGIEPLDLSDVYETVVVQPQRDEEIIQDDELATILEEKQRISNQEDELSEAIRAREELKKNLIANNDLDVDEDITVLYESDYKFIDEQEEEEFANLIHIDEDQLTLEETTIERERFEEEQRRLEEERRILEEAKVEEEKKKIAFAEEQRLFNEEKLAEEARRAKFIEEQEEKANVISTDEDHLITEETTIERERFAEEQRHLEEERRILEEAKVEEEKKKIAFAEEQRLFNEEKLAEEARRAQFIEDSKALESMPLLFPTPVIVSFNSAEDVIVEDVRTEDISYEVEEVIPSRRTKQQFGSEDEYETDEEYDENYQEIDEEFRDRDEAIKRNAITPISIVRQVDEAVVENEKELQRIHAPLHNINRNRGFDKKTIKVVAPISADVNRKLELKKYSQSVVRGGNLTAADAFATGQTRVATVIKPIISNQQQSKPTARLKKNRNTKVDYNSLKIREIKTKPIAPVIVQKGSKGEPVPTVGTPVNTRGPIKPITPIKK